MDKKVSIIVPVYNVEKYIEECVRSLVGQTYTNLEIILVDDASPDRCGEICDHWAHTDPRIRVIHKKNGGAASARNAGLDAATGELICFVDSDDSVEPEYIRHLVQTLETHHADVAVCGFSFRSQNKDAVCAMDTKPGLYGCEAYMLRFLKDWSCSLLWNKLFRREAIGEIRMEEGHKVDDEYFTYQVCMNCGSIAVSDTCLYHYRLRASSVMQDMAAVQEKIMVDRIQYNVDRYRNVSGKMPALASAYFAHTLDTLTRYWHHSKDMPVAQKEIRKWVKQHTPRILQMRVSIRCKLGYLNQLYLRKPAIMSEPNPIQMDPGEYFD